MFNEHFYFNTEDFLVILFTTQSWIPKKREIVFRTSQLLKSFQRHIMVRMKFF